MGYLGSSHNLGGYKDLYDMVYVIETMLAIILYIYLIRIANLFLIDKKCSGWLH